MRFSLILISILLCFHTLSAQVSVGTAGQVQWCYWQNLPDNELEELYAQEFYPNEPDGCHTLFSLQSPENFDNLFGDLIRGYIRIDTSCQVRFAVTGDSDTQFYLSSNANPNNVNLIAYVDGTTGNTELDKDTLTQWSDYITLIEDTYYYFELSHIEGNGADHSSVWWKTPFTGLSEWNYISSDYINDIILNVPSCPPRHTICDDGNANTIDDQEDGFCNCIGEPTNKTACVGERFDITRYVYTDISGSNLSDLLLNPNYPTLPTTSKAFDYLGIGNANAEDDTGSLIEGFVRVPVSGTYHFNITGNARARMFLSSDHDPSNKAAHQMLTLLSTGATAHIDDPSQSMLANLVAGEFYYFEITHKEGTGSEHLGIFWKTPFAYDDHWKRVPLFYLYDYDCELACIPDGTACDDGDPFTNNDQYSNCDCVGTPCSGPDCDSPLANYSNYPECDLPINLITELMLHG